MATKITLGGGMLFSSWRNLAHEKKRIILATALVILLAYVIIIYFSASAMFKDRAISDERHVARMSATGVEPGRTPPDVLPEKGDHVTVKIGTYVENIDSLSIRDNMWNVIFYVWFSWKGDAKLDPGGKLDVVDGMINKKELLDDYHDANGTNYQRYCINAKIIKFFDTVRVPIEDHMLNIYIEDGTRDGTKMRYVADETSNISSRLNIPGFKITGASNVVKTHTYKSPHGDPRLSAENKKVFSQYIAAIKIVRVDLGFYFKIFLYLFAALLLTLASLFIKSSDASPRFSLPTAAYFGAVANSYMANALLPPSGVFGLVDYVSGIGLFTIFITIAASLVSNYYSTRKDDEEMSFVLDRVIFLVVGLPCVAANIFIPWVARG
jgi:ABC-type multidrug transport system fused ATPase/permease subunit